MSKWYASCILLRLEKEKEPEKWKNLHIDGIGGLSCQHLQVMVTNLIQKHWEWQEERNPAMKHGTVVRPTMYMAVWIIAAVLRGMSGLSGKAIFECVESRFAFNRCLWQGKRGSPAVVAKDGNPDIGQCGGRIDEAKKRCSYGY